MAYSPRGFIGGRSTLGVFRAGAASYPWQRQLQRSPGPHTNNLQTLFSFRLGISHIPVDGLAPLRIAIEAGEYLKPARLGWVGQGGLFYPYPYLIALAEFLAGMAMSLHEFPGPSLAIWRMRRMGFAAILKETKYKAIK